MKHLLWLLLSITLCVQGAAGEESLKLLARSHEMIKEPGLTTQEWRWLREHRKIRMAVWQPMLPPYDSTTGLHDYGGINADFVGLVAENLGIEIEVVSWPDYSAALAALHNGDAEFIAQAGDKQQQQGLLLSAPYSANVAVEIVNAEASASTAIRKIAISSVYDSESVQKRYPDAELKTFSSARHALEALAFRKIDLFFCDAITARYLVSQSNLSNLTIRPVASFNTTGFAFAADPRMHTWIAILNKILKALPDSAGIEIHRRWDGGIPLSFSEQRPVFTSLEQKWIKEHEHIRVAVAEDNAPIAWFDESNQLHGIIADVLTALSLRTGFTFDIHRYPTQQAALAAVKQGNENLVAGATQEGIWLANLLTTRTWLYNSWVMVGRAHHVAGATHPRIISLNGEAPEGWLRKQNSDSEGKVDTWHQGLDSLVRGENDMMTVPLIVANTQLTQKAFASLKILASVDTDPMRFAFGASRDAWPLTTILNKALINIPPEDLHALTRGSGACNSAFASLPPGKISKTFVAELYCAGTLLLLASLGLAYRMRSRKVLSMLNAIPVPVYVCDSRGKIVSGNRALYEALSIAPMQVRGKSLTGEFAIEPAAAWQQKIVRQPQRTLQLWRGRIQGRDRFIGGWIDISRQHQFVQTLRNARHHAKHVSRIKSAFLATMSHEIRTPVSAIIGMLELVMKRPGNTQQNAQSIRTASDAAQSLLQLIGNILDVSRIESGRLMLRPERASLRNLIETSAMLFEGLAAQKSLEFGLEIDAEIKDDVLADIARLRQIIVNLLGNAIKFTDSGKVTLRAQQLWQNAGQIMLSLQVEDTGEGIDEATQQRLFRPFQQGSVSSSVQGSGLGLYICRTLAEMMDGGITLQSTPGEGTRVTVTMKLSLLTTLPANDVQTCQPDVKPRALNVMIVDDNDAGRMLLNEQLSWLGHHVMGFATPLQALAALETVQPDAIISDCTMPEMSGYAFCIAVHQRYPALPVLGMTADAREAVRDEAQRCGMHDCVFKPVTLAMLETMLGSIPSSSTQQTQTVLPHAGPGLSLPPGMLDGDNLITFLTLQIAVLDETLAAIARWYDDPHISLYNALHKVRGGIQLLGADSLAAHCNEQEQNPNEQGIRRLEEEICQLRAALIEWQETGLHPHQTVLQQDEEEGTS